VKNVTSYRGQPLMVLLMLLGGWTILRVAMWQSPFDDPPQEQPILQQQPNIVLVDSQPEQAETGRLRSADLLPPEPASKTRRSPEIRLARTADEMADEPAQALVEPIASPLEPDPQSLKPLPPKMAAGINMMLLAGFAQLELPPDIAALLMPKLQAAPAAVPLQPAPALASWKDADRWSADAWVLLREDTTVPATSGRGSYGQSQVGLVARYRLAPSSGHRPTLYIRASKALAGGDETEAALGFAARPIKRLPVTLAAELRVTGSGGKTYLRPAAYAVTELPPFDLPAGFTGEVYAQAGYVGGDFATAFVDGQLRADRRLFRFGGGELRGGGGIWGGAQKGAGRLDIGPGVTLQLELGGVPSRVSMDWRFRIAGEAEPRSGPALTISAGF